MANDKPSDKHPKKVDASQYKDLQMKQTAKAQEIISSQQNTYASAQNTSSTRNEMTSGAGSLG